MVYLYLFFAAFLSGSLLPMGSEGVLIYDVLHGYSVIWLLTFATAGNVLGSILNYYLGLKGEEFLLNKNYLNPNNLQKAKKRFKRYGAIALLFSFMPIVGDPLTFIAGVLEYNFKKFLLLVTISKACRYFAIVYLLKI